VPQLVGTGVDRVLEHVDGGPELLPDDGSPIDIQMVSPMGYNRT